MPRIPEEDTLQFLHAFHRGFFGEDEEPMQEYLRRRQSERSPSTNRRHPSFHLLPTQEPTAHASNE